MCIMNNEDFPGNTRLNFYMTCAGYEASQVGVLKWNFLMLGMIAFDTHFCFYKLG